MAQRMTLCATCLAVLMMTLDATIVNVALPAIESNLGFDEASLAWVVNGYTIPYGGCVLLCGRLGDHYGHQRLFLTGIAIFTLASCGCSAAASAPLLVGARFVQGLGAATVSAVALSLLMNAFTRSAARARALAAYSCVSSCGAGAGLVLGGLITSSLGWRWIFLINIPVGVLIYLIGRKIEDAGNVAHAHKPLDVGGAITITAALMLAIGAILSHSGSYVCGALVSFSLFVLIEARAAAPLIPLGLFKHHNLRVAGLVGALWSAAQAAWFFFSALDLGALFGHDAFRVGLAFLPATALMSIVSLGLSAKLVVRFGFKRPLAVGMACIAISLAWQARAPTDVIFWSDVLPSMLLLGIGVGIANAPYLQSALTGLDRGDYGLASGVLNGSRVSAGALGLSVIASMVASRSSGLIAAGMPMLAAMRTGYALAYGVGAIVAAGAVVVSLSIVQTQTSELGLPDTVAP